MAKCFPIALQSISFKLMYCTQISLEEQQYETLVVESRRRQMSLSALIRQLVSDYFEKEPTPQANLLKQIAGIGEGDGHSVGRQHNQFLYGKSDH